MKAWFLFLLLLSFQTTVSCKRRRSPTGLKMNDKERCIIGYGRTLATAETVFFVVGKLAFYLTNELSIDILIPYSSKRRNQANRAQQLHTVYI